MKYTHSDSEHLRGFWGGGGGYNQWWQGEEDEYQMLR